MISIDARYCIQEGLREVRSKAKTDVNTSKRTASVLKSVDCLMQAQRLQLSLR